MNSINIALLGNPNSGKTTLFNSITGAHRQVGNYPGITVEKHMLSLKVGSQDVSLVDLPGTYSLSAFSEEEVVVRHMLNDERPQVAIDVVNANALERNLYLAVQLMELQMPTVIALNMMDEAEANGLRIDVKRLSEGLGLPVVPCVGRSGKGVPELLRHAITVKEASQMELSYGPDIDPLLLEMTKRIEAENFLKKYPARWVALKFIEGDSAIAEEGHNSNAVFCAQLQNDVAKLADHIRTTLDTTPEGTIADYRYGFIHGLLAEVVTRTADYHSRSPMTAAIDALLLNRLFGPIFMLAVLWFTYWFTLNLGAYPQGWVEEGFGWLNETATNLIPEGLLQSLIVSGIIDGVGGVLGFTPLIFFLFIIIAILEDSGYMARVAHLLDRIFRMFGLQGCSVMPFIVSGGISGGCAIPGIMAARTLRNPQERLATILTAPFMSCGAKVPVFLLLVAAFFPESQQTYVLFSLTLTGWAAALLVSLVLRKTVLKSDATPFVLEIPPYRMPTLRGVLIHAWERTWMYIKKAGTVILAVSIVLWAAMTFPELSADQIKPFDDKRVTIEQTMPEGEEREAALLTVDAEQAEKALVNSVAGRIGVALEPVMAPVNFDWRMNIALLAGIAAKEVVVSTLGTAYSLGEVDPEDATSLGEKLQADPNWNMPLAVAFMLFVLLYAPCFVAVAVLMREAGSWKWAAFSVIGNTIFAYCVATAAYHIIRALM